MRRSFCLFAVALLIAGCGESSDDQTDEIVRGLKAFRVTQTANTEIRRYPSIVEPAKESKLSFEVSGQLREVELEVGQKVIEGEVLAEINSTSLELQEQEARARLEEARANLKNAQADFERKRKLRTDGFVTQAEFDQSTKALSSAKAQVEQSQKQLEVAQENLNKATMISPFDGVLSSVDVESFAQVAAGQQILGIYSEGTFEISFRVPSSVINIIKIGDPADIQIADLGSVSYKGHIKEIGSRAASVSAFPVVVTIDEKTDVLRAGMAAEVTLSITLGRETDGYLIPLSAFYVGSDTVQGNTAISGPPTVRNVGLPSVRNRATLFLFDEDTSTVKAKEVDIAGIRENMAIVFEGINEGDIVAVAGVSFLKDGQKVRLLPIDS